MVKAEELQASLTGQDSVFSALAELCSAQGLCLRCCSIGYYLEVRVAS